MTSGGNSRHGEPLFGPWLVWLGLFVLALALLGGSSRPDPVQNAALRPIAALLLIPALYRLRAADCASAKAILVIGGLMLGWMVVQLVPLPPAIWRAFPGRDAVAALDRLAGIEGHWRPLSLAPFRGLNALLGMLIPLAALLLALSARLRAQGMLLVIAGIGVVNAACGILQVIGGPGSLFYLYAKSSRGAPAGIFANENHSAAFSAIVLLVIARLATSRASRGLPQGIRLALAPAALLVLIAVLISGSRAGFAASLLALGAGGLMIGLAYRHRRADRPARSTAPGALAGRWLGLTVLIAGGAAALLVIAAFLLLGRTPALDDMLATSTFEDLRWSLWPVLAAMMRDHWLLGTGFGAFDAVYRVYEPTSLLLPVYVNHAHNDWAQLVIEGGLPAAAGLLALIGWLAAAIVRIARRAPGSAGLAVFWIAALAIIMAVSLVDYPLRTPIFQAAAIWLMLCLAYDGEALNNRGEPGDRS